MEKAVGQRFTPVSLSAVLLRGMNAGQNTVIGFIRHENRKNLALIDPLP
jgi:hypothetical protein